MSEKEKLKLILINYAKELGISPKQRDINSNKTIPSTTVFYRVFGTLSWSKILAECDLDVNLYHYYDKQEALNKLKEFYNQLDRIPTREDFKTYNFKPHQGWYAETFGSYEEACKLVELSKKPSLKSLNKINISICELRKLANELNRCPTVKEYDNIIHKGLKRRALENSLGIKYNDICRKYVLDYIVQNIHGDITKEDIINEIKRIHNIIGRPPMFKELKKYNCCFSYNAFNRVFNGLSYNQIIESLGWIPTGSTTLARTEESMLTDFYNLYKQLQRIPTDDDLNENGKTATATTYKKYFRSVKNICQLLDIDYNLYINNSGFGKVMYDMNGELCRSTMERDITNYFIVNNIFYIKEFSYSNLIENDTRRFDWKILVDGKCYFIEYFGMYDINKNNKIINKYANKTKKKIKSLYKNGYYDQCIFLFPNMIKNKSFDEVFKKYFRIKECVNL